MSKPYHRDPPAPCTQPRTITSKSSRPFTQNLSGVDGDTFRRLFPKTAARLYVARIRSRTSLVDIFPEVEA